MVYFPRDGGHRKTHEKNYKDDIAFDIADSRIGKRIMVVTTTNDLT